MLDISTLTLAEIAHLEKMSGLSVDQMGEDETPKGDLLAAMVVIVKKRNGEPTFTFKQAQQLGMAEVKEIFSEVEAPDEGKGGSSKNGRGTSRRSSSTSASAPATTGG